jgi:hypothetical protein
VALFCGCEALAGLLELFLVPLYAGKIVVPIAVLLAVGGNIALPLLGRSLVGGTAGAVLPFLTWLAVVIVVGMVPRPEGDVVLPGGGALVWVSYGVLLGGTIAGTVTIVLASGRLPDAPPSSG